MGMVDKALAFQFGGEGSNPAETCREAAGSDVQLAVHDITLLLGGDL